MSLFGFILDYWKPIRREPLYKPVEPRDTYNPYEDPSLHKISRIKEYFEAMAKVDRCPICGSYLSYVDTYQGNCPSCDSKYYGAMRRGVDKIKAKGFDERDVTGWIWARFYIVSVWLEKSEVTHEEAKAYAGELLKEVATNHQQNLEADRRRAEPSPAQKLSDLI